MAVTAHCIQMTPNGVIRNIDNNIQFDAKSSVYKVLILNTYICFARSKKFMRSNI